MSPVVRQAVARAPDARFARLPKIQRKCASCGTPSRGECDACMKKRVQRLADSGAPATPASGGADLAGLERGGVPLANPLRGRLEPLFGASFADVRVHDDAASHQAARDLHAHAFTVGQHVHFAASRYRPAQRDGLHLLAHELAHTIQQRGGLSAPAAAGAGIDAHDAPLEREADRHADAVVAGHATQVRSTANTVSPSRRLQRRWDPPRPGDCHDIEPGRWLKKVVVEQETPQSVTLHWSDGTLETSGCSTGKGHCCVDTPEGTTCDRQRSRQTGSNCTPISSGAEFPIIDRRREHNTWQFWNTFVPSPRSIALHEYPVVDGTPLSHGCVRLPLDTARHIFCGERQNRTMVEVRGFARPQCGHRQLQEEWKGDVAGSTIPGSDGEDYRQIVRDGYGHDLTSEEASQLQSGTSPLPLPPRCPAARTAVPPTAEEKAAQPTMTTPVRTVPDPARPGRTATVPGRYDPTVSQQVLEASGFESLVPRFTAALAGAANLALARQVVLREGRNLWNTATRRAQRASSADTDDRPLYWARLEMTRALRAYQPGWNLGAPDRDALLAAFERASRGMDSAAFPGGKSRPKRILISGFDPFGGLSRSNPSGAAALALDGQTLAASGVTGRVEAVIFPVRFEDFNAGRVESFFAPYLTGTNRVDMVMTISMGGSSEFEVEEFAARRRTIDPGAPDNLGVRGDLAQPTAPLPATIGGTSTPPTIETPGVAAGPQFLRTTLPPAVRNSLRSTPLAGETEVTEVPRGGTTAVRRPTGGPTAGSTAIEGSGGNYLSNEIFYRTRLLRDTAGSTVPLGHLHTPLLASPATAGAAAVTAARDAIVARIRQILVDTLPSL